jgi:uncharacterized protein YqfA (UPF0365 family)
MMQIETTGTCDELGQPSYNGEIMMLAQVELVMVLVIAGVFLILALSIVVTVAQIFTPWLQAFMAGAPVSVTQIIGMRLRKVDVRVVVNSLIMATQAGVPVSSTDFERAYLQGVDLEKITLALIHGHREGKEFTFQELVDADLENRLHE